MLFKEVQLKLNYLFNVYRLLNEDLIDIPEFDHISQL